MLRKSLMISTLPTTILPWDRKRCVWLTNFVIFQCVLVYVGSATIIYCVWAPVEASIDYSKLVRIMYLYDYAACGYKLRTATALSNIRLPNQTYGLDVKPITWQRAIVTVSTRLSAKTRRYIEISMYVHLIWMISAAALNIIIRKSKHLRLLKYVLATFFYISVSVIIFDISMAIVYIADIQQSLSNGMILRYSGWSVELKLQRYDDFAGWLPMAASVMWMRGIVILAWNIYCCKIVNFILKKIKKKEVTKRLLVEGYIPIPEPQYGEDYDDSVLHYRRGGLSLLFGWLVLGCKFQPNESEYHELTLMKLLYLYDPEACGRIYFYNYTRNINSQTMLVWPEKNGVAASFRSKVRVYLSLHVTWAGLGLMYVSQSRRPCGLYVTLLPFTMAGIALLITDLVYTAFFLMDISRTGTEENILEYINNNSKDVLVLIKHHSTVTPPLSSKPPQTEEDTTWICLLLSYISCRAVVQWMINFWVVKDNYFEGLELYRSLQNAKMKRSPDIF